MLEQGVSRVAVPSTPPRMYKYLILSINNGGAAEAMQKQIPRRRRL